MHGASRNAEKYINDWLPIAQNRNVVLIAPEFSKERFPEYVYLMMSTEKGKLLKDQSLYLNDSLGLLFDFFKAKLKLSTTTFRLYGHSGGSQFVNRYLLLSDETRIEKAAMANAGFYTFLDRQSSFPFGIKNMNVSDERIEWFLRLKGGVFLGDADNDPAHHSLPSMRKAKKQGRHRYERGTNFFNDLIALGVEKNLPFRWRYQSVPRVAHDNAGMSLAASEFLLEDL
jgi:pimeloyl-ACP methyl ester carboxylesterase